MHSKQQTMMALDMLKNHKMLCGSKATQPKSKPPNMSFIDHLD